MNANRQLAPFAFLLATLVAAGCNRTDSTSAPANAGAQDASTSGGMFTGLASEAQKKIAEENLSIGNDSPSLPKAELTPQGDLLIGGNKVAVTAEQHALLVRHREILEKVASDGVAVGMEGANLAGKAISNAFSSALSGDSANTKARIESDASNIKSSARQLCAELPLLLDSQEKLAAALPEFRPYARMTEANVKDCHSD
jgi:hypothetical protein